MVRVRDGGTTQPRGFYGRGWVASGRLGLGEVGLGGLGLGGGWLGFGSSGLGISTRQTADSVCDTTTPKHDTSNSVGSPTTGRTQLSSSLCIGIEPGVQGRRLRKGSWVEASG